MSVVNEYIDPDVAVEGQQIVVAPPRSTRFLESSLKFFNNLHATSKCRFEGCDVNHRKYALHVSSNQPCVFDEHTEEGVYYLPYACKTSFTLRTPRSGDRLITGVQWFTINIPGQAPSSPSVRNSCMIDGFLTDLKLRSLDRKFCFECLFMHTYGEGRTLERCLRSLVYHVLVFAKPIAQQKFVRIRKFSYEEDLKIKRIWLDKDNVWQESRYNDHTGHWEQDLLCRTFPEGTLNLFLYK